METNTDTATQDRRPDPPSDGTPVRTSERDLRWKRFSRSNPRFRMALIIGGIVVVVVGFFVWRYLSSYESTDDAQIDGHVNPVSARVSGHVEKLLVQDNQYVAAGTPLVQIDPSDYQVMVDQAKADYQQALAAAEAAKANVPITSVSTGSQVSTAQAEVEAARAGISAARQQFDASRARVQEAEANNTRTQNDLARYQQLIEKQEISRQQYDQAVAAARAGSAGLEGARASAAAAEQQVHQAQSKLQQATANLRSAGTGPQQVTAIKARAQSAEALAKQKKAQLDQAELNLQYTLITSPVNGIVSGRSVEVGQNVQPGQQLMSIINLDDIWVTANFKETQLHYMRPGQLASISVDAFDHTYKGHVQSIAGASGARFSLLPPENASGNYVKVVQRVPVKITFDQGETRQHALRPGMSVDAKVWIR